MFYVTMLSCTNTIQWIGQFIRKFPPTKKITRYTVYNNYVVIISQNAIQFLRSGSSGLNEALY